MPPMHMRRSLALVTGALLLAAPLSSCGFDLATDRIYTPAAGANERDASVDILNAVIVSAEEGSGTFVATFVNNDTEQPASVQGLAPSQSGAGSDPDQIAAFPQFSPIEIEPGGLLNLAGEEQGVAVEGDFKAGDVVSLEVQLSGGEVVEVDTPVVPNCHEFEGIDGPGGDCEIADPVGGGH